ncbi:MAG: hypothetical protein QGH39_12465 [Candidatus Thermoplasmatota archaeon]|jgi:archaellum component FlaG (FlaF/FlaG flagellin family)|nr:hypothetical protein [Candidatus Thermoplasmatota archaeon]
MAATSASHLIWFIAAVIAATAISGVMVGSVFEVADKLESSGRNMAGELATDISIENDVAMVPYNATSHNLTIYLKNIGSKEIYFTGVNYTFPLFLSGPNIKDPDYIPTNMTLLGGNAFLPGLTLRLTYNITLPSYLEEGNQYHMKIIASEYANVGDSTYFRITEVSE